MASKTSSEGAAVPVENGEKQPLLQSDSSTITKYTWEEFRNTYVTKRSIPMLILLLWTIVFGTANRVIYKIQLVPMGNYALFISWVLDIMYTIVYFGVLGTRTRMEIVKPHMFAYVRSPRGLIRFITMGLMDAIGFIVGIYAAREITGYLLTLLPQGLIPITMILSVPILGTRYLPGQVIGALILVAGLVISLIPDIQNPTQAARGSIIWAVVYFFSIVPNAISFILREKVFQDVPDMDIFIVNSFDSVFQLAFSVLFLPIVIAPGFGDVPASELGSFVSDGAHCIVGMHGCTGEPYLMIMYVVVNLSWNISLLLLVKKGGAVLSFISAAVSTPISHLMFAINWPLLPATPLSYFDIIALFTVLAGLIVYRVFSVIKMRREEAAKRAKSLEEGSSSGKIN